MVSAAGLLPPVHHRLQTALSIRETGEKPCRGVNTAPTTTAPVKKDSRWFDDTMETASSSTSWRTRYACAGGSARHISQYLCISRSLRLVTSQVTFASQVEFNP